MQVPLTSEMQENASSFWALVLPTVKWKFDYLSWSHTFQGLKRSMFTGLGSHMPLQPKEGQPHTGEIARRWPMLAQGLEQVSVFRSWKKKCSYLEKTRIHSAIHTQVWMYLLTANCFLPPFSHNREAEASDSAKLGNGGADIRVAWHSLANCLTMGVGHTIRMYLKCYFKWHTLFILAFFPTSRGTAAHSLACRKLTDVQQEKNLQRKQECFGTFRPQQSLPPDYYFRGVSSVMGLVHATMSRVKKRFLPKHPTEKNKTTLILHSSCRKVSRRRLAFWTNWHTGVCTRCSPPSAPTPDMLTQRLAWSTVQIQSVQQCSVQLWQNGCKLTPESKKIWIVCLAYIRHEGLTEFKNQFKTSILP